MRQPIRLTIVMSSLSLVTTAYVAILPVILHRFGLFLELLSIAVTTNSILRFKNWKEPDLSNCVRRFRAKHKNCHDSAF